MLSELIIENDPHSANLFRVTFQMWPFTGRLVFPKRYKHIGHAIRWTTHELWLHCRIRDFMVVTIETLPHPTDATLVRKRKCWRRYENGLTVTASKQQEVYIVMKEKDPKV